MSAIKVDKIREERIEMEIVVDAYGEEERAMGWYYYLADKLQFSFKAACIAERTVSPLSVGDLVEVVKMAPEWRRIESLFVALGAQTIEGNGSRVRFVLNGIIGTFHRPHPAKEAKPYQVRDARTFLENAGVKP